jgi:hypothetical protein
VCEFKSRRGHHSLERTNMGQAHAQTLLPDILVYPTDPFVNWIQVNWVSALIVFLICLLSLNVLRPFIRLKIAQLRGMRLRWDYQRLMGRQMSARAKRRSIGEHLAAEIVQMMDKGIITRKEKREYLRRLEIVLELDQGDLAPKPHKKETKRRILGRLHGKVVPMPSNSNVTTLRKSASSRLAGIMSK